MSYIILVFPLSPQSIIFLCFSLYVLTPLRPPELTAASGPGLVSGQGLEGPDSSGEIMRIHRENQAKLQGMSQSEILEDQKKLLSQLGRQRQFF